MNDLFLSYDKENEKYARYLAKTLEDLGWKIWWDQHITPEQLKSVSCVLVLFSLDSLTNDRVNVQAKAGTDRNRLIPIRIGEKVELPANFQRFESADLTHWDGSTNHPSFIDLIDKLERVTGLSMGQLTEENEKNEENIVPGEESLMGEEEIAMEIDSEDTIVDQSVSSDSEASEQTGFLEDTTPQEEQGGGYEPQDQGSASELDAAPGSHLFTGRNLVTAALFILSITFAIWYFTKYKSDDKPQMAQEIKPVSTEAAADNPLTNNEEAGAEIENTVETNSDKIASAADETPETAIAAKDEKENQIQEKTVNENTVPDDIFDDNVIAFLDKVGKQNMTLNEKLNFVENSQTQNSVLNDDDIKKFKTIHNQIIESTASLNKDNDFVICGGVVERQPTLIKEVYPVNSKVWPWVRANSPRNETLTLRWINKDTEKIVYTSTMNVKTQTTSGWRTWSAKTMKNQGNFEVRLFNAEGILIGKSNFRIQ